MKFSLPAEAVKDARQQPQAIRSIPDPISYLENSHAEQLRVCDLLEEIADSLPLHVDRLKCFYAAGKLRTSIRIHQMDEDRGLFPILRRHAELESAIHASLERLEGEHLEDESLSHDIIDALERLSRGQAVHSVDGLSYMLRAFFDSHRRHIAFENEVILPKARQRLQPGELAEIEKVMLENRSSGLADFFSPSPCASAKAAFFEARDCPSESAKPEA